MSESEPTAPLQQRTLAWLRLALAAGVGPVVGHQLLEACGGAPEKIFSAPPSHLAQAAGVGPRRLEGLADRKTLEAARRELELAERLGVSLLTLDDPDYPALLRRMEYPPLVLWVRGRLSPADRLAVTMVGPRKPSSYGRLMTERLAGPLAAQGLTIVSGLAFGVDAAAHRGALEAGGRTLAVLGQGLGTPVAPQTNAPLAAQILEQDQGALLSVFPLETAPAPGLFPQRNEIVAALALATVVVEASPASGALITARHALTMGRRVMACPGDATRLASQGANRLIADGAHLIQTPQDVLEILRDDLRGEMAELEPGQIVTTDEPGVHAEQAPAPPSCAIPPAVPADPVSRLVVGALTREPQPMDLLIEHCAQAGHPHCAVLESLLQLEINGVVRQLPGRLYALRKA